MNIFYKGEDITLTFVSETDISTYSKSVKCFTPNSAIKEGSISNIDNFSFTVTFTNSQTGDLKTGSLNIVLELTKSGAKSISKTVKCKLNDAYLDGGEREDSNDYTYTLNFTEGNAVNIVFGINVVISQIYSWFTFIWKLFSGFTIAELRLLTNSQLALVTIFSCNEQGRIKDWYYDSTDTTSADNNGTILVTSSGKRLKTKILTTITPENFGATGDGTTNDTIAIQNAVDYLYSLERKGTLKFSAKVYKCREVEFKQRIDFIGEAGTILRFYPSGDNSVDATRYVVKSTGAYGLIDNIIIDGFISSGVYAVGNGLFITPDSEGGLERKINNVRIEKFAGYKSGTIVGGSYGVNKNYAREDISDGSGSHLLIGGNGVVVDAVNYSSWNLTFTNSNIQILDGDGFNGGTITDSKLNNLYIGQCVNRGFVLEKDNKNCHGSGIKVFLCRNLNPRGTFQENLDDLVPHETTLGADQDGAVVLTGANHVLSIEVQENAGTGVKLGTSKYSLNNCYLNLIVDGNGGYNKDADSTTLANYRRYGILAVNYYKVMINGVCDDFRSKFLLPRQERGWHSIGAIPTFTNLGQIVTDNWYMIADNSGGADFTPLQKGLSSTSNVVGTIFQARANHGEALDPTTNFGTGYLRAVNDFLFLNMVIINQREMDYNTGLGYSITNNGNNSLIQVNDKIVKSTYINSTQGLFQTLDIQLPADSPKGLNIAGVGTASARLFFSSPSDPSNAFCFRKSGDNLIISTGSTVGSSSGTSRLLLTNTGTLQPATNEGVNLGASSFKFFSGYFTNIFSTVFNVLTGTNGGINSATLSSGTVTITNSRITSTTELIIWTKTVSGTMAVDYIYSCGSGTATITAKNSSNATETGCNATIKYLIINPY